MKTPRTLIIGLDGATFDLIGPLSQAGYLPNLSRLMEQGAYGPLNSWPNMNSAAAWSSIVTGCNPERDKDEYDSQSPPATTVDSK